VIIKDAEDGRSQPVCEIAEYEHKYHGGNILFRSPERSVVL
jgi:hypothetical protein